MAWQISQMPRLLTISRQPIITKMAVLGHDELECFFFVKVVFFPFQNITSGRVRHFGEPCHVKPFRHVKMVGFYDDFDKIDV